MSPTIHLDELARQVRACTLKLLEAADKRWLTCAPPGTSNHILWHAGHTLWVQDALCIRPLARTSELPKGWGETFGQHALFRRGDVADAEPAVSGWRFKVDELFQ